MGPQRRSGERRCEFEAIESRILFSGGFLGHEVPPLMGGQSRIDAVSSNGLVLGEFLDSDGSTQPFVLSEKEGTEPLNPQPYGDIVPKLINTSGEIAGFWSPEVGRSRAFFYSPESGFRAFGSLVPQYLSDDGELVLEGNGRMFSYRDGKLRWFWPKHKIDRHDSALLRYVDASNGDTEVVGAHGLLVSTNGRNQIWISRETRRGKITSSSSYRLPPGSGRDAIRMTLSLTGINNSGMVVGVFTRWYPGPNLIPGVDEIPFILDAADPEHPVLHALEAMTEPSNAAFYPFAIDDQNRVYSSGYVLEPAADLDLRSEQNPQDVVLRRLHG